MRAIWAVLSLLAVIGCDAQAAIKSKLPEKVQVPNVTVASVSQFDLKCTGSTSKKLPNAREFTNRASVVRQLRLDLDAKRWCEGKCEFGIPLGVVSDTDISFINDPIDTDGDRNVFFSLNRNTGVYIKVAHEHGQMELEMGQCVKQPYTTVTPPKI